MDNKLASTIIIVLCALSIILGVNVSLKKQQAMPKDVQTEQSRLKNMFVTGGDKIALISLEGPISSEQSGSLIGDLYSAESVQKALKQAKDDGSVKGILLRINSPGGTVAMSQEIYNTVMKIRKEKPVVVSMADVAASGGYYISSAADRIYADPGTLTGSIGVIFNTVEVTALADKVGISSNVIKSGKFKDIGSMYRKMSSDERELLQSLINQTYNQFLGAITAGRVNRNDTYKTTKTPLTVDVLKKYADGRIMTGEQASILGFVDSMGDMDDAYKAVSDMAIQKYSLKTSVVQLVPYNRPAGISNLLFGVSENMAPGKALESVIPFSVKNHHKTLYMWE